MEIHRKLVYPASDVDIVIRRPSSDKNEMALLSDSRGFGNSFCYCCSCCQIKTSVIFATITSHTRQWPFRYSNIVRPSGRLPVRVQVVLLWQGSQLDLTSGVLRHLGDYAESIIRCFTCMTAYMNLWHLL